MRLKPTSPYQTGSQVWPHSKNLSAMKKGASKKKAPSSSKGSSSKVVASNHQPWLNVKSADHYNDRYHSARVKGKKGGAPHKGGDTGGGGGSSGESSEEIDSDEAFDSDDERKYGDLFANRKGGKDSESEDESDDEESEEEEEDDEELDDETSSSVDEGSDGNDGAGSSGESDVFAEGSDDDSDDSDNDGGQYMRDLMANLSQSSSHDNSTKNTNKRKEMALGHASIKENQFLAKRGDDGDLTIDGMLEALSSNNNNSDDNDNDTTSGLQQLKRSVESLERRKTAKAPAASIVVDRVSRKEHYRGAVEDVSQWIDAVKGNREAETLDFRPKNRVRMTNNSLANKFEADNDFERRIQKALEARGKDDDGDSDGSGASNSSDGEDDLGRGKISRADLLRRHGELAKVRSLLFYEELKRNQMNKIKSKKYRKIRKKQSDREKAKELELLRENDPEEANRLDEEAERARMQERMTLQHKNTSKWARQQLRRGKNTDTDSRRALSEQIAMGDALRRKQVGAEGSDGDSGDDGEGDDPETLKARAREVLRQCEDDKEGKGEKEAKGLFALDFMKRGLQAQRETAAREARQLLEELEGDDEGNEDEYYQEDAEQRKPNNKKQKPAPTANFMEEGKLQVKNMGGGGETRTIGNIEIDLGGGAGSVETSFGNRREGSQLESVVAEKASAGSGAAKAKGAKKGAATVIVGTAKGKGSGTAANSNPWMVASSTDKKQKKGKDKDKDKGDVVVNVKKGVDLVVGESSDAPPARIEASSEELGDEAGEPSSAVQGGDSSIYGLTQEELVRRAFSGVGSSAEEEFAREKAEEEGRLNPKKEEDDKVSL